MLFGLRIAFKEDFTAACAELVYSTKSRIPGEFTHPSVSNIDPDAQQLKNSKMHLRPVPTSAHCAKGIFVHKDLQNLSHVLFRYDTAKPLPHFSDPHKVLALSSKTFKIDVNDKKDLL